MHTVLFLKLLYAYTVLLRCGAWVAKLQNVCRSAGIMYRMGLIDYETAYRNGNK